MRRVMYDLTRRITCFSLFCYFREIRLYGLDKVPRDRPVMFLANHQNALLDPLVVAAFTPFRTYFLTRADVFINPVVNQVFSFLRMLPVYRMRDGRDTLERNQAIFENCTRILEDSGYILLFPEANHNIMRRVRPLSKGFTRILFATLEKDEDLDVCLVPVGINYECAAGFPDRVAFYFGEPISSRDYYDRDEIPASVVKIKNKVSESLQRLTTHVEEEDYSERLEYLDSLGLDYLDPEKVNTALREYPDGHQKGHRKKDDLLQKILMGIFLLINAPVILIWRGILKPRILEVEFVSTFRFAYALVAQPIFYVLLWGVCYAQIGAVWASVITAIHFLFCLFYIKMQGRAPR